MNNGKISTNLLGRTVILADALRDVPNETLSRRAKTCIHAEVVAVRPTPFEGNGLYLTLQWEDDGSLLDVEACNVRVLAGNEVSR